MPPRDWRSRSDESNSHYPADAPHQQRQLTALERQAYALESLDLSRSLAEEFHDIDGLDDRIVHRVNTIARRSRTITILDAIADPQLFGQHFRDHVTWAAWCVFLCALFGLPL